MGGIRESFDEGYRLGFEAGEDSTVSMPSWKILAGAAIVGLLVLTGVGYALGPYAKRGVRGNAGAEATPALRGDERRANSLPPPKHVAKLDQNIQNFLQKSSMEIEELLTKPQSESSLNRVIDLSQKAIKVCDQLRGQDSLESLEFHAHLARIYRDLGMLRKSLVHSLTSALICRREYEAGNPDVQEDTLILVCDNLIGLYTSLEDDENALKWAKFSVLLKEGVEHANVGDLQSKLEYASAMSSVAIIQSRMGQFEASEETFGRSLDYFYRHFLSHQNTLQTLMMFMRSLYMQGKMEQFIIEAEKYERLALNDPSSLRTVMEIWRYTGSLLNAVSDWTRELKYLLKCFEAEENFGIAHDIDILSDIAGAYWETGDEASALKFEGLIRRRKLGSDAMLRLPRALSTYLATLSAEIIEEDKQFFYNMDMKLARIPPSFKEGEKQNETQDNIPRKLTSCFVKASFENTDQAEGAPPFLESTVAVTTHTFSIRSPSISPPQFNKWYKAVVLVYRDESMSEKIGEHHQLVYAVDSKIFNLGGL